MVVAFGSVFMEDSTIQLLLVISATAATLISIYLVCSKIFGKLGSFLSETLFGDNENVLFDQNKYTEAMGYNSFEPNEVVITESQISIKQYSSLYESLFLLTLVIFFTIYSNHSPEIDFSFSNDNLRNTLNFLLVASIWPIYIAYIQLSNIFFSIYLTKIFINENKISLKTRFREEQVIHVNNFQYISFSYRRYFNGLRNVYYKVFLHYKGRKCSVLCNLTDKKQVQFAILSLENAMTKKSELAL